MTIYSKLSAPIAAKIEITSNCNNHCVFCYNVWKEDNAQKPLDMQLSKIKRTIDELSEMRIMALNITGGEPFLRKDIYSILKYAKNKKFIIFINTNGNLIDDKCAKLLKKLKINGVTVSLHGLGKSHDKITCTSASFNKAVRGIKNLIKNDVPVKVNYVISQKNYKQLKDALK